MTRKALLQIVKSPEPLNTGAAVSDVAIVDFVPVANGLRLQTITIPGATHALGEPGCERSVTLPTFAIARDPVTYAQFAHFVSATGYSTAATLATLLSWEHLADHPVTMVTLADAQQWCRWYSRESGVTTRLPTGDEWESVARCGDDRQYPWGHSFDETRAACAESGWGGTAPVDFHPGGATVHGVRGMAGNVWEWTSDRDPDTGWVGLRGGCWLEFAWGMRASRVLLADPTVATSTTGFRPVTQISSVTQAREEESA